MPWLVGFLYNVAAAYAISWAINYFWGKKSDPQIFSPKFEDNQAQVRSAVESHKIVYGKSLTSGPLVFAATNGANNQYIHMVVPVAGHEVEAIDTVYFDDISSSGTEYNKLEQWVIVGGAALHIDTWSATIIINGKYYGGTARDYVPGTGHLRIKTTRDVMGGIYACILATAGYASENFTVSYDGDATITLTGKTLGDEITVSNYWTQVYVPRACDGTLYISSHPGQNDVWITRTVKSHIFDLYKHLGEPAQIADSILVAENVGWTADHRLRGRAYIYTKLGYYPDRWPTGIPNLKAEVRGRKVYDPRSTLTAWSDNAALCIRDYLTSSYGLSCSNAEIDDIAFIAAANTSDEYVLASSPIPITSSSVSNPTSLLAVAHKLRTGDSVVIAGHSGSTPSLNGTHTVTVVDNDHVTIPVTVTVGGSGGTIQLRQKRYTCNGTITLGERPIDVIQKLLTCCDGTLVYSEGKYKLFVGAYTASVGDLNESHLRSGLRIVAKPPRKQLFNGVRGTILDPNRFWQETDFPEYKNSTYATDDGEEIIRDITLPFTTDSFAAQRIAKQILERSRQAITVVFPAKLNVFKYAVNDVVRLSISYLGWVNKEFRIQSWSMTDFGVDVLLQEESSASYNWNNGDETIIDPAPDSQLPSIFEVSIPTGLTLTEERYQATNTTDVRTRIRANWNELPDPNTAGYILTLRSFSDHTQETYNVANQETPIIKSTTYTFEDIAPGYYYVGIKSINTLGIRSLDSTFVEFIISSDTSSPPNVTNLVSYYQNGYVYLKWQAVSDYRNIEYEVRKGPIYSQAQILGRTTENTQFVTDGDDTYWVVAYADLAVSATPASIAISFSRIMGNIVATYDEQALGWLGTLSGLTNVAGALQTALGGTGTYTIPAGHEVDIVTAQPCACSVAYVFYADDPNALFSAIPLVSAAASIGGNYSGMATSRVEIATAPNSGTYGAWQAFVPGIYIARKFKFRIIAESLAATIMGVINGMKFTVDMPDRIERGTAVSCAAGGLAVAYAIPFQIVPNMQVTINAAVAGDDIVLTVQTVNGCTIQIVNGGVGVARNINWMAQGY
jgi:hypothetical protein